MAVESRRAGAPAIASSRIDGMLFISRMPAADALVRLEPRSAPGLHQLVQEVDRAVDRLDPGLATALVVVEAASTCRRTGTSGCGVGKYWSASANAARTSSGIGSLLRAAWRARRGTGCSAWRPRTRRPPGAPSRRCPGRPRRSASPPPRGHDVDDAQRQLRQSACTAGGRRRRSSGRGRVRYGRIEGHDAPIAFDDRRRQGNVFVDGHRAAVHDANPTLGEGEV